MTYGLEKKMNIFARKQAKKIGYIFILCKRRGIIKSCESHRWETWKSGWKDVTRVYPYNDGIKVTLALGRAHVNQLRRLWHHFFLLRKWVGHIKALNARDYFNRPAMWLIGLTSVTVITVMPRYAGRNRTQREF